MMVKLLKSIYRPVVRRAARQILEGREIDPSRPDAGRWLRQDVREFVNGVWRRIDELIPVARLETLPTWGNRHNVFLAVLTTAAYQEFLQRGVPRPYAATLMGDIGWKIYGSMLRWVSLPFRMTTGNRQKAMERTLRALMVFPFSAPGAPGYEAKAWSEGDRFYTWWTHCPPQTFVRNLVAERGDLGELDAFIGSWCQYDWNAADVLAADGDKGHYARPHTLSRGDSVCDMCWHARAEKVGLASGREGSE
jgi:hypothetical protein